MAAGRNTVIEAAADAFSVQAVTIARPGPAVAAAAVTPSVPRDVPGAAAKAATVVTWTPSRRVLQVAASQPSYLIVNENFNAGWSAVLRGRSLQPVQLDGWKQGWLLPAGSRGLVTLTYRPDAQYRVALFTGLGALGLILLLAAAPFRRRLVAAPVTDCPPGAERDGDGSGDGDGPPGANRAMRASVLCAGVLLAALLGLWTGGYVGSVLLPAMTVGFLMALSRRRLSRLARVVAEPWLIGALLAIAAVGGAVGNELFAHGIGGAPLVALGGVIPELACLGIVGRVIVAVLAADG